jgi:hypothetical protein
MESSSCDVSCNVAQDCRTLGVDYRCEAGSCRPLPELALNGETLRITPEQAEVEVEIGSSVRDTQVVWLEDRFRVGATVWEDSPGTPDAVAAWNTTFVVADLFSDGRLERRMYSNESPLSQVRFTLGDSGAFCRNDEEHDPGTFDESKPSGFPEATRCRLTFHDADLTLVSTETLPCDQGLRPITSDANGDWLTWAMPAVGDVSLGRYRPSEQRWTEEPQRLAVVKDIWSTQLRDGQFWIQTEDASSGTSSLTSVPFTGSLADVSQPEAWQTLPLTARILYSPHQQLGWRPLLYRDGWLTAHDETWSALQKEAIVRAVPIDPGQSQQAVSFAVDAAGTIGFGTLRQIPGRDLVIICYVDYFTRGDSSHMELKLSWFDTTGAALGGPLQLASSEQNLQQCTLTWSGSSLLATWMEGGLAKEGRAVYARRVRVH